MAINEFYSYILTHLKKIGKLEYVSFEGNPMETSIPSFLFFCILELPKLKQMDWRPVTKADRSQVIYTYTQFVSFLIFWLLFCLIQFFFFWFLIQFSLCLSLSLSLSYFWYNSFSLLLIFDAIFSLFLFLMQFSLCLSLLIFDIILFVFLISMQFIILTTIPIEYSPIRREWLNRKARLTTTCCRPWAHAAPTRVCTFRPTSIGFQLRRKLRRKLHKARWREKKWRRRWRVRD